MGLNHEQVLKLNGNQFLADALVFVFVVENKSSSLHGLPHLEDKTQLELLRQYHCAICHRLPSIHWSFLVPVFYFWLVWTQQQNILELL